MPFIDYETCEPLRIWARLEPRARRVEFDTALAARVHDPMWMLARQWQMGEFKGEDTGSAVLAKLARRVTPVGSVQVGGGPLEVDDLSLPAETRVERLPIEFPDVARARLGRRFLGMLDEMAAEQPPSPAYDPEHYRALFREEFRIEAPAAGTDKVARVRARVNGRVRRMAAALAGRAVDGVALYRALSPAMTTADLPPTLATRIVVGHEGLVLAALEAYRSWFAELYPDPPAASGWDQEKLEYRAACTLPREDGTVTLTVDEHVTGRLDWSAFDQGPLTAGMPSTSTTDVRSVIPAPAEFAGMPNPRWWQFEDAAVGLGGFSAQATDLAKIVVAEFALLYGNNWLVVPYRQPIGSLSEIEGVVLTDVFGRRTLVEAAVRASGGKWTSWDLFSLSPRGTVAAAPPLPQHLFLPAGFGKVQEAQPHETVALVRDESANMVWGVERRVPDGLGASQDGTEAARRFTDALAELEGPGLPPDEDAPTLRWRLGTNVPESWIPFVPVHRPGGTRDIHLLRAAMPRFVDGEEQFVRPRTSILRPGLAGETQTAAYLLDEEEVPRAGVNVHGAIRRARWLDGATVVWHGRTVATGRGETDSGLRFDAIEVRDPRADTTPAEA